jgi:voltage-gated potassium channel
MDQAGSTTRHRWGGLRGRLRALYHGASPTAVRFRLCVLGLDLLSIGFFIVSPLIRSQPSYLIIDYLIAAFVGLDLLGRALAGPNLKRWTTRLGFAVDAAVLVTLMFPLTLANFAFLRVMRLWSVVHSELFWRTVARRYDDTRWEDTAKALATLVTYLFVVTGMVYALFAGRHDGITSYLDALYFTVAAITTTGFGDVVLPGSLGKLVSIVVMISGISLFVRLVQALSRPDKIRFECPTCGLRRHDLDAVHCKACGALLHIPNDEL